MEENNQHFFKVWKKYIVYGVLFIIAVIAGAFLDFYMTIMLFLLVAVLIFAFYYKSSKGVRKSLEKFFQYDSPVPIIDYYNKIFEKGSIPDHEVLLAYNTALILCYYGKFDQAMERLNQIDWKLEIPYFQSFELSIKVLIEYIKTGNYEEGLRLSYIMQSLGQLDDNVPGAKQSRDFYQAYIQVGELLTGNLDEMLIISLEEIFERTQFFPKMFIAWGLANVYHATNHMDEMHIKMVYLKSNVPYCEPLNKIGFNTLMVKGEYND